MPNSLVVKNRIKNFNKKIKIPGDKSLSIRWALLASLSSGTSKAKNLLMSEDVKATLQIIKKFGIKVILKKNVCKIFGKGMDGYNFKKNQKIDAKNSGTLARLILGLIVNSTVPIKLIGDNSLSKRDFDRIINPLKKFGVSFKLLNKNKLPLIIKGSNNLKGINYEEKRGSAQCKSSVIFAGMRSNGKTIIKAKKSRNHTELMCKYLNLPIKITKKKKFDLIEISKVSKIPTINYNIPSDISSGSFFMILVALLNKSKITLKNININPSRIGIIIILKKMGVKIKFLNSKIYNGEKIADIIVESPKKLKAINCPTYLNSGTIDEFLSIFLVAAKANGVSYFKDLAELNNKESPRLIWGSKILNLMGVKNVATNNSIKIFGNPSLKVNKRIVIKNFLKDHRVFMTSVIAALSFQGKSKWQISDVNSIKTSFPNFLIILKKLGAKIN